MQLVVRAFPVLAGREEQARQVAREMETERSNEAAEFFRRHGVARESWHAQVTDQGMWILGVTEFAGKPIAEAARDYAGSQVPFDRWLKEQVKTLTGIDPDETPLGPPTDCVFDTARILPDDAREANRALARRWMREVWNERREHVVDELMAPSAVGHMEGGDVHGPAGFKAARAALLDAVPDLRIEVLDAVAERDDVVLRWRVTGTHTGGGLGIPPSGRAVEACGMSWFRIVDGKMAEGWDSWNLGALLERLRAGRD